MVAVRFTLLAVPTVLLVPRPQVPLRWFLGLGIGTGTVQFGLLYVGMAIGMPSGLASLVLQASVPFTVVLGAVFLRERLSARQVVGVVVVGRRPDRHRGPPGGRGLGRRARPGAADRRRRSGLGLRQHLQPPGPGAQAVAPDAVDVGDPAGPAAGALAAARGSAARLGRRSGRPSRSRPCRRSWVCSTSSSSPACSATGCGTRSSPVTPRASWPRSRCSCRSSACSAPGSFFDEVPDLVELVAGALVVGGVLYASHTVPAATPSTGRRAPRRPAVGAGAIFTCVKRPPPLMGAWTRTRWARSCRSGPAPTSRPSGPASRCWPAGRCSSPSRTTT